MYFPPCTKTTFPKKKESGQDLGLCHFLFNLSPLKATNAEFGLIVFKNGNKTNASFQAVRNVQGAFRVGIDGVQRSAPHNQIVHTLKYPFGVEHSVIFVGKYPVLFRHQKISVYLWFPYVVLNGEVGKLLYPVCV